MPQTHLHVRRFGVIEPTVSLVTERTALLLVDCNDDVNPDRRAVIDGVMATALRAAREAGVRPIYIHEAAYGVGGPTDVTRVLSPATAPHPANGWTTVPPAFPPSIAPRPDEAVLPKCRRDAFDGTHLDYWLKTWGIDTVVAVGFALRSCLYHTCVGARWHNYRLILLRDCTCPPGVGEFPDTVAPDNPEGGWMRFVFLRMIEANIGYTSTSGEFASACASAM